MSRTLLLSPSAVEAGLLAAARPRAPQRAAALKVFAKTGLPHRRMEAWKWTDLRAALAEALPEEKEREVVGRSLFAGVPAFEITIMNGEAAWGAPAPAGVEISLIENDGALSPAVADHPLANLCAASAARQLHIVVAAGAKVATPIHLRQVSGAGAHHVFAQMRLAPGAEATVLQSFDGAGSYFSNALFGFGLDEGAQLTRLLIQDGSSEGVEASVAGVRVGARARFTQAALLLGAKAARVETRVFCLEESGAVQVASAALLDSARHADQTSLVSLHASGCSASQLHKSALRDRSRAVFQGKFHVTREGRKADAHMSARALLLNEGAEADHKPELEIYADEVQCAHGSTIGALDDEALFYLQQRGLSPAEARALLVEAFVSEVFDAIPDGAAANAFRSRAARFLEPAS
jgi:Fe-S cluster assembly protein SufD